MTNAEKYLKDGVDVYDFLQNYAKWYNNKHKRLVATTELEDFLTDVVKPTLTEDERVILRNIAKHSDFEKIGRDKIGGLYVTCRLNIPTEEKWAISFFDHLFQFIKERRRILY